jgi:hypothetical protein
MIHEILSGEIIGEAMDITAATIERCDGLLETFVCHVEQSRDISDGNPEPSRVITTSGSISLRIAIIQFFISV